MALVNHWGNIRHFKESEFSCKCGCGQNKIQAELVYLLQDMRDDLNLPMVINSGYRCPAHNKAVGGVANGAHVQGLAADIACKDGHSRLRILHWLMLQRIQRVGIYKNFIHVDLCKDKPLNIWVG